MTPTFLPESECPWYGMAFLKNASGTWACHEEEDDVLGYLAKALTTWQFPAISNRLFILHTPTILRLHSTQGGVEDVYQVVLSDRWQAVQHTPGGQSLEHLACVDHASGDVVLEHHVPHGASLGMLTERWRFTEQHAMTQLLQWYPDPAEAAAGAEPVIEVLRLWHRSVSVEERALWDEMQTERQLLDRGAIKYNTAGFPVPLISRYSDGKQEPVAASLAVMPPSAPATPVRIPLSLLPTTATVPATPAPESTPTTRPSATPLDIARCAAFTGSWAVDKRPGMSESLDGVLSMMGVPWLARRVADNLDITTVIRQSPPGVKGTNGKVHSEDVTSVGVLASTDIDSDGVRVARVGADGKTAHLTCSVEAPSAALLAADKDALSVLRMITELPDGAGTNDNLWVLLGGSSDGGQGDCGRCMRQVLTFTKGKDRLVVRRLLINKDWTETKGQSRARLTAAANAALEAITETAATAAPTGIQSPSIPLVTSDGSVPQTPISMATAVPLLDPFFVSLTGIWQPTGAIPHDALSSLRSRAGDAAWSRLLVRPHTGGAGVTSLVHTANAFDVTAEIRGVKARANLPVDGLWYAIRQTDGVAYLMRAFHIAGGPDPGPTWLGTEAGQLPGLLARAAKLGMGSPDMSAAEADACLTALDNPDPEDIKGGVDPYSLVFSCAEFFPSNYEGAELVVETAFQEVQPADNANGEESVPWHEKPGAVPRLAVHFNRVARSTPGQAISTQSLMQVVKLLSGRGVVLATVQRTLERILEPGEDAVSLARAERARLGAIRSVLLQRRGAADKVRRQLLLAIQERRAPTEAAAEDGSVHTEQGALLGGTAKEQEAHNETPIVPAIPPAVAALAPPGSRHSIDSAGSQQIGSASSGRTGSKSEAEGEATTEAGCFIQ